MKALAVCMLLVAATLVVVPTAAAGSECMEYHRETHVGPYIIVQRSSCHVEVCYETTDNCGLLS